MSLDVYHSLQLFTSTFRGDLSVNARRVACPEGRLVLNYRIHGGSHTPFWGGGQCCGCLQNDLFVTMQTTAKGNVDLGENSVGFAGHKFGKPRAIADQLGVCPRTLFRWADAGLIKRHKINARVVLFDETEVLAFIRSARIG